MQGTDCLMCPDQEAADECEEWQTRLELSLTAIPCVPCRRAPMQGRSSAMHLLEGKHLSFQNARVRSNL